MTGFDHSQGELLDQIEIEILSFATCVPDARMMEYLREELEHFGLTLGTA